MDWGNGGLIQKNDDSLRGSLIARMNEKNDADSSKIFGFYNELR